jgi:hypothetical protein
MVRCEAWRGARLERVDAVSRGAGTSASGEAVFAAYLNWLRFGEATLTFPQTIMLRYGRFEPEGRRIPQAVEDYRLVSRATARHRCAARYALLIYAKDASRPDISVGYALMLARSRRPPRSHRACLSHLRRCPGVEYCGSAY